MKCSEFLQKLLNSYPDWSRVRNDISTVGGQFLAPFSMYLAECANAATEVISCRFPQVFDMNTAAHLYYVILESSFEFELDKSDPYHPRRREPTITCDAITVTVVDNLDDFYNSVPTRITLIDTFTASTWGVLDVVHDGTVTEYTALSDIKVPGPLAVSVSNSTTFTLPDTNSYAYIQLEGVVRQDTDDIYTQDLYTETILIPYNTIYYTKAEWKQLTKVTVVGLSDNAEIKIGDIFGQIYPRRLHYSNLYIPQDRELKTGYVTLRSRTTDLDPVVQNTITSPFVYPMITVVYPIPDEIYDYELEYDWVYELITKHARILDFDVCPFTYNIYLLGSDGSIHIHDLNRSISSMVRKISIPETPHVELRVTQGYAGTDGDVRVDFTVPHPLAKHAAFSLTLEYNNGTKYTIQQDGSVVAYDPSYNITTDRLNYPIYFTPPSYGPDGMMLKLVNYYVDRTSDYDYAPLYFEYSDPLITITPQYTIDTPDYLYFGADNYLYIGTSSGTICQYQLNYDYAFVDYDNKTVIFREQYDEVEITA